MNKLQIDWNDVWHAQMIRHLKQLPKECTAYWQSKEDALEYFNRAKKNPGQVEQILQNLPLTPESLVLDIGAGPGSMAIPMSAKVAHVTAVEQADGMMAVLMDRINEHDISNITCVKKRWEDVKIIRDLAGPYDIVIASHSLSCLPDIKVAIQAMCVASRKWVYIFWNAGIPSSDQTRIDLWPLLHGDAWWIGPKTDVLYHLLYDMGIYPNVKSEQREYIQDYPDIDTAVAIYGKEFEVSTPEQETILREYLQLKLQRAGDKYILRSRVQSVMLWWDVTEIQG
jgi:SAM-dependent methyltransferase